MPPISDTLRLIIWIITGSAAALGTALSIYLEKNISYTFRQWFDKSKGGPKPGEKSFVVKILYVLSIVVLIAGTAIASSAPQSIDKTASTPAASIAIGGNANAPIIQGNGNTVIINPTESSTLAPTLTISPSATPTPVSIPMSLSSKKVVDTGIKGGICGYSKVHSVVRDLNGDLHIFFTTGSNPTTVFETVSKDNGETWSPASFVGGFVLQGTLVGFSCSAALDPTGNIHLFFDLSASDIGYTSWSPNAVWKDAVIRGQGLPDVGNYAVNIATGPGNQVHAVWSSRKLWYTFFDGSGWSRELEVAPGGWHPDIFVDANDVRHVVFNGANPIPDKSGEGLSPVTVYYTSSADGIHWSDEKTVPPDDGVWKGDSTIKVDSSGRRHVTYIEWAKLEGDLYYTYSDDGEAWSQPIKLNLDPGVVTGSVGSESAAMLLDINDNLYVAWQALTNDGKNGSRLLLRWLNKSTHEWSDPLEIARIAGGIGDQPSMPYQVYGWKDRNHFSLDIVWSSAGEIYYGQINFKDEP
jgi:hypothetical protein